jgi:hypothetical protein
MTLLLECLWTSLNLPPGLEMSNLGRSGIAVGQTLQIELNVTVATTNVHASWAFSKAEAFLSQVVS